MANPPFSRQEGTLFCEELSLPSIADTHGTPLFVYSAQAIQEAYRAIDEALSFTPHMIAYAVKANDNLSILRTLRELGAGVDIVSGGELARVLAAGFQPEQVVYSGVGKTDAELVAALDAGIHAIHVESEEELAAIERLARSRSKTAKLALRINPDVNPETHPYIATGLHGTKFGLELDAARRLIPELVRSPALQLEGIACHIGSQIQNPGALEEAVAIAGGFAQECRSAGAPIKTLDAGGGWPIDYAGDNTTPRPGAFGQAIAAGMKSAGVEDLFLTVELGRSLVGKAGVLVSEVVFTKQQPGKTFIVVDAAMTELLRPALYQARHQIRPVVVAEGGPEAKLRTVDVVGPVCESGDFLGQEVSLGPVGRGDLIAIKDVGAYGAVMSSRYNARPRAAEVLVRGNIATLIRRRESQQDLWHHEVS